MAAIYLKHPVHGYKVASGTAEADYDRSNGWEVLPDPPAPKSVLVVDPVPVEVPVTIKMEPEVVPDFLKGTKKK